MLGTQVCLPGPGQLLRSSPTNFRRS